MEASIVEALRLQTGQLSGYAAQSAKAVTGALDAQTRLQAQIAREAAETDAMRARRPSDSTCASITGLTGLAGTRGLRRKPPMPAPPPPKPDASRATGPSSTAPAPAAGDAARFETVTGVYCNAARAGEDPNGLPGRRCAARGRSAARQSVRPAHFRKRGGTARRGRALAQPDRPRGQRSAADWVRRHRPGAPPCSPRPLGRRPCRARQRLLRPRPVAARARRRARRLGRPGRAGSGARLRRSGQPIRTAGTARQPPLRGPRTGSSACKPCPRPTCCASWSPCKRSR